MTDVVDTNNNVVIGNGAGTMQVNNIYLSNTGDTLTRSGTTNLSLSFTLSGVVIPGDLVVLSVTGTTI